jgi:hypothetical protein
MLGLQGLGSNRDPLLHRGAIVEFGTPICRLARRYRSPPPGQITLAGLPIPPLDETKHFKFIGPTGTGKSSAFREVLSRALERGDRAVIAEPNAGYLARFYDDARGDVILNPFDSRSLRWDPWSENKEIYDYAALARALIPDGAGEGRMWRQHGQTFFSAVMRQAHRTGVRETTELYRLLTSAPAEELQLLLEGTPAQPYVTTANQRMFGSIRSVATNAVSALDYIQRQTAPPFSIRRWIREGRGVLFLPYAAGQIAALRSIISTWMHLAIFETMTLNEGDARVWFAIDELDASAPSTDSSTRFRDCGSLAGVACSASPPADTPQLPSSELMPGGIVFVGTVRPVCLGDYSQWWRYVPGAN